MFNPLLIATIMGINCLSGAQFIPAAYEETPEVEDIPDCDESNEVFYSLDEYNEFFGHSSNESGYGSLSDLTEVNPLALSPVTTKTAVIIDNEGDGIGTVTLQYQTQIVGGRPQFVYSTCYLGHPVSYNGWTCVDSNATFSGDVIKVYATFALGPFDESGVATFRP